MIKVRSSIAISYLDLILLLSLLLRAMRHFDSYFCILLYVASFTMEFKLGTIL